MFSDKVYEIYARWEQAQDVGTPFDLDQQCLTPEDRDQVERLIAELKPVQLASVTAAELPPSTERYHFLEFIARGGMGEVFRGEDTVLNRTVAIKVLRKRLGISAQKFRDEAVLVARLTHPGIVPVHDFGVLADDRPFFVMRLVEGKTLEEVLGESTAQSLQLPRWLQYFEQVCQSVAYAHAQKPALLHRDLKPQNVMIGAYGEVLVMDWGIARVVTNADFTAAESTASGDSDDSSHTGTGVAKGTAAYMAPEQARGERDQIGPRSDVFGLGGILCRILTGKPTFPGDEGSSRALAGDLSEAHARLQHSGADPSLVSLAESCLTSRIEDRLVNAGGVAEGIHAYLDSVQQKLRNAEVDRARAETKAEGERRRRRLQTGLAFSLLALFVVVGLAGWWWKEREARAAEKRRIAENQIREFSDAARLHVSQGVQAADLSQFEKAKAAVENALAVVRSTNGELNEQGLLELQETVRTHQTAIIRARVLLDKSLDIGVGTRAFLVPRGQDLNPDYRYSKAFAEWGLKESDLSVDQMVKSLRQIPTPFHGELIATIDAWWQTRRGDKKGLDGRWHARKDDEKGADWRKLMAVANGLDPDEFRKELREMIASDQLQRDHGLAKFCRELMPVTALVDVPVVPTHRRLRDWARGHDPAKEGALTIVSVARALDRAGAETDAADLLRRATNYRPSEALHWAELTRIGPWRGKDQFNEAVECWKAVRAIRPETGIQLALALANAGRDDEAGQVADSMKAANPRDAEVYFHAGIVRAGLRLSPPPTRALLEQAVLDFEEAIRLDPDLEQAHFQLELTLSELGKYDAAAKAAVNSARRKLGIKNTRKDSIRPAEARELISAFRQGIQDDPGNISIRYTLASLLVMLGELAEAERVFLDAQKVDPNHALPHLGLAELAARRSETAKADKEFEIALRFASSEHIVFDRYAEYCIELERYAEAERAYRQLLQLRPRDPVVYSRLSNILRLQKRLNEAEENAKTSIELAAAVPAILGLAQVLAEDARFAEAEQQIKKCLQMDPTDAGSLYHFGLFNQALGRFDDAENLIRQAAKFAPDAPTVFHALGQVLTDRRKYDEAQSMLLRSRQGAPDKSQPLVSLARCYQAQRRFTEAESMIREAIKLERGKPEHYTTLAYILLDQRRFPEAIRQFRLALGFRPDFTPARVGLTRAERFSAYHARCAAPSQSEADFPEVTDKLAAAEYWTHYREQTLRATCYFQSVLNSTRPFQESPQTWPRIQAARAATIAASGEDPTAVMLDLEESSHLHRLARKWLRDDMTFLGAIAVNRFIRHFVAATLLTWRKHPDFFTVRDPSCLALMPEPDRLAWQQLWADWDALLVRNGSK